MIKKVTKEFIMLLTFTMVLLVNFSYAEDFYYGDLQTTGYTQMEDILEAKKKGNRIMIPPKISGEYMNEEAIAYVDEHIEDFEPYYNRNDERHQTVIDYIEGQEESYYEEQVINDDNVIIQSQVINENSNIISVAIELKFIIILVLILVIILLISIVKRNKIIFIIDIGILILTIFTLLFYQTQKENKVIDNNIQETNTGKKERIRKWRVKAIDNYDKETKDLLDLLNGYKTDKKLEGFAERYKKDNIDIYNENEVDLSRVVNDYIIKCYYCIKRKAKGKELYSDDIDVLNCFNDPNYNYDVKYYSNGYTSPEELYKYEFMIKNNLLTKESMKGIYDNITDEDIQDYNDGVYLDKLVEKIGLIIKSKDDFDAYNIIPYKYFNITRLDLEPLYKCKYWYLEKGQDTELKLPYETVLKYEVTKYEKRNVEKWYYAEIKKLVYDYDDEKTIFAYYLDNQNNLNGLYTTVYSDGLYNLKELTDEIKYSNVDIYTQTNIEKSYSNDTKFDNKDIDRIIYRSSAKVGKRDEEYFSINFLNKYRNNGILPKENVDSVNNETITLIDENLRKENKYFCKIDYLGTLKYEYALYKIIWKDNKVDDIEYYIIPEDKMNLSYEEMYKLAFND